MSLPARALQAQAIGRRSGVVVRADVRRDSHGFEDIDDFWAEDSDTNESTNDVGQDNFEFNDSRDEEEEEEPDVIRLRRAPTTPTPVKAHTHLRRRASSSQPTPVKTTEVPAPAAPMPTARTPPFARPPPPRPPRTSINDLLASLPEPVRAIPTTPPATLKKTKPSPVAAPVVETTPTKESAPAAAFAPDPRNDDMPSEVDISFGNMSSPASTIKNRRDSSSMDLSDVNMTTPVQSPRRPSPAKAAAPKTNPPMNDESVSDASIFSLRVASARRAPVPKAAPLPLVRSQDEEESKAADDEQENATGHRSFELEDDFDFDAPSRDDDDDNTFGAKNTDPLEANRGSFGGNMTPIAQTEDHDLFSPPEVRPQFSSPPVSPMAHRPTTPPTKKASKKSRTPVASTSDNENDMFEDASLVIAVPKTKKLVTKAKAPKRTAKGPKELEETNEPKEPKARGRPKKKKLAETSFNDATDHSDTDAPPRRQDFTDNDDGGESDPHGPRRSKRRRIQPLAWYKCERPVYERRDNGLGLILPTISHIERAGTNSPIKNAAGNRKKKSKHATFPASQLPPEFKYSTADSGELWDEASATSKNVKMIGRYGTADLFPLPAEDGVPSGFACQTFNVVGSTSVPTWISGRVLLPPGAVKASESVGSCAQVFIVIGCQPMALEVAFGHPSNPTFDDATASRFTLGPGDEFYVPANNAYFLRNHSPTVEAELRFMILKPKPSEKSKKQKADAKKPKKPKNHKSEDA